MDLLQSIVNYILNLGPSVFVGGIMIIIGLIVKMKAKDAISAGITLGVAFTGMSLLIGFMMGAIGPAATAMVENTGISLPILDGGWTTLATLAWSWPYAFVMFPVVIGVNIIMLVLNKTNTINADMWNVWGKIFTAVCVTYVTGNVILAFVIAAIQTVLELMYADMHATRIEKLTGIPGVTCTHRMTFTGAIMYPVDVVLRKIPAFAGEFDAEALRDKIGIFAENHVLGAILGLVFGALARFSVAATLILAIQCATALTLFPVIAKYFMSALEPISDAINTYMQKRFSGRQLSVGLDWPFLGGSNEIWIAIIINVPIALIYAFILPGNELLPFAGILNVAIAVSAYLVTKGNIKRMLVLCVIFEPIYLYVATWTAPLISELANSTGAIALEAGQLISCACIDGPWFTYGISHMFLFSEGNFLPVIMLAIWMVGFYFYRKELLAETEAAKNEK
jgi:PTS system galactitol-specific IIC component